MTEGSKDKLDQGSMEKGGKEGTRSGRPTERMPWNKLCFSFFRNRNSSGFLFRRHKIFNKLKEKYFNLRYKIFDWWNPHTYYRLPLSDHEKDFRLRIDLQLSVGEVFNGYKIQDVSNIVIGYKNIDSDSAGDPSDVIESEEVNRIEVTLNELYSRQVINPDTLKDANFRTIDFIKDNAIESFRNEIDKKGWTNLLIRDGIRIDVFKEIWVRWKRWHQWINWIFRRIVIPYNEKEEYVVCYGVRMGGYNEKAQAAKK